MEKINPSERVGVLALGARESPPTSSALNLGIQMVEYSELSPKLASLTKERGSSLVYRFANIASHYFSLDFLEMAATRLDNSSKATQATILPAHIARKHIRVYPDATVSGLKLERFIFDILHLLPSPKDLAVMLVSRKEEFSPLKNASVPGKKEEGTPESCRDALYEQFQRLFEKANLSPVVSNEVVEIEPYKWYFGEPISDLDVLRDILAKK